MQLKHLGLGPAWLLAACASTDNLVVGKPVEPINAEEVEVYVGTRPQCDFDVIAYLRDPGTLLGRESLIDSFKASAAALGANAIEMTHLEKLGARDSAPFLKRVHLRVTFTLNLALVTYFRLKLCSRPSSTFPWQVTSAPPCAGLPSASPNPPSQGST